MPCWPKEVVAALRADGFRQRGLFVRGDFEVLDLDDQVAVTVKHPAHISTMTDCLERAGFTIWCKSGQTLIVERD